MYIFGKNNNHLIKNNYKTTFSLPQKIRLIQKQITQCACGHDFIICLTKQLKPYCYFQSAVYNIDFKEDDKIVDIATEQNLILFITEKGQLYSTEFMGQKLINDTLKPKIVRLNLGFLGLRQKIVKQVKMINGLIFLKLDNNAMVYLKRNNWTETKAFSDPQIVYASKNSNIQGIALIKNSVYFLTSEGGFMHSTKNQIHCNSNRIQIKQKLTKIVASQSQIYALSEEGCIAKVHFKGNKAKFQKMFKISSNFVDLAVGNENYYAITQDRQAWVWGKNAYGQLGLSDYQPRNTLYPMVSLQRFFIRQIFTGQNYVCCLIDENKIRQSVKITQRASSVRSPIRQVRNLISQNNRSHHYRDSFNQTEELIMPIQYTETESQISSKTDQNQYSSEVNVIVNKRSNFQKDNFIQANKSQSKNQLHQRSLSKSKAQSKASNVSNKKLSQVSCNKSTKKSGVSQSKVTPKSVANREKSMFKNQPQKTSQISTSNVSDPSKSHKKQIILNYKTPNKPNEDFQKILRDKIQKEIQDQFEIELEQRDKREKQRIDGILTSHQIQKEKLEDKIHVLEMQLKNKTQQNRDLFDLITHKNLTIDDITAKIKLLQQAIEQHEKTLTARDNQAEEYFLRQKQYQLHIQKLQSQVQKMMEMLNFNERNRQTEIYKKQMQRLSSEIKERIEGEKQYYRERMKSIERQFQEEKNIYELQIRNLQEQLSLYKKKEVELIGRIKNQRAEPNLQIHVPCSENNSSRNLESPTFHTIDLKSNLKKQVAQPKGQQQGQTNYHEKQTVPLKESNRQDIYFSPFEKNKNEVKTRKNSRANNFYSSENAVQSQNIPVEKSESQVKQILQKIQKNKSCISKSANKLFNLLECDKN